MTEGVEGVIALVDLLIGIVTFVEIMLITRNPPSHLQDHTCCFAKSLALTPKEA